MSQQSTTNNSQQPLLESPEKKADSTKNDRGFVFVALMAAALFIALVGYYFNDAYNYINNYANPEQTKELVTYYQWTSATGEQKISREKPQFVEKFMTFQGAANLLNNENKVDAELLRQSAAYQAFLLQQQNKPEETEEETDENTKLTNTYDKAKNCIEMSSQLNIARLEEVDGKKTNSKELRERIQKECQIQ